MATDFATQETTVLGHYPSRHDAEIASAFLRERGIASFVSADDVHVVIQFAYGARLLVLAHESVAALDALREARLLPADVGEEADASETAVSTGVRPRLVSTTAWLYIIISAVVAALVLTAIL